MNSTKPNLAHLVDVGFVYRALVTLIIGVIIAGFLTWFMHALIESSQKELDESLRANLLDFVRVKPSFSGFSLEGTIWSCFDFLTEMQGRRRAALFHCCRLDLS